MLLVISNMLLVGISPTANKLQFLGPVFAKNTRSDDDNRETGSVDERLTLCWSALCVDILKVSKRIAYAKALTKEIW